MHNNPHTQLLEALLQQIKRRLRKEGKDIPFKDLVTLLRALVELQNKASGIMPHGGGRPPMRVPQPGVSPGAPPDFGAMDVALGREAGTAAEGER